LLPHLKIECKEVVDLSYSPGEALLRWQNNVIKMEPVKKFYKKDYSKILEEKKD